MANTGERYLSDGVTVRCQGVSKGRLRERREQTGNYDLTSDDVWPELQCIRAALPGAYACKWHGGASIGAQNHHIIPAAIPDAIREKVEILLRNPDYINRHQEIVFLQARWMELVEDTAIAGGGKEAWEQVLEATDLIEKGQVARGVDMIRRIADNPAYISEVWDEIRATMKHLESMTRTQVTTAQTLGQMMTAEQTMSLIEQIFESNLRLVEKHIKDPTVAKNFLLDLAGELRKFADTRALGTFEALGGGDY